MERLGYGMSCHLGRSARDRSRRESRARGGGQRTAIPGRRQYNERPTPTGIRTGIRTDGAGAAGISPRRRSAPDLAREPRNGLVGGVLWVFAATLLATALSAAVTGSAVAQKALTWVVAAAAAGVAFLVAAYVPTSR
jgi:hypothetical protein